MPPLTPMEEDEPKQTELEQVLTGEYDDYSNCEIEPETL